MLAALVIAAVVAPGAAAQATVPTMTVSTATVPTAIEAALASAALHDPKPLHAQDRRRIVVDVYSRLDGMPAWFAHGLPTPMAVAAGGALARIEEHGLDPSDYEAAAWPARLARAAAAPVSERERAAIDVALTRDLVHAASDLLIGRIDPAVVGFDYPLPPDDVDLAAVVVGAAAGDAAQRLDALAPTHATFQRLRDVLRRYRQLAAWSGAAPPIGPSETSLRLGDRSPDLPAIARLLVTVSDLAPEDEAAASLAPFCGTLEAAVRRFQERHGLVVDGRIGRETRREMRVPMPHRVRQIELTMERWRWLPRTFLDPVVLVNVPAFRLSAFDSVDGTLARVLTMRAIVGREYEGRRTPLIASRLEEVVFSPSWLAPPRLAREELLPFLLRDSARAGREGYVIERGGEVLPIDAESAALVRAGRASIRQAPGPANVLGGVRFGFPNRSSTYLHGTSNPELFERSDRALSHGCIRVEDPVALAQHVLRHDPSWTRETIMAAMASGETLRVPLPGRDRVVIVYGTASAAEDGTIRFFRDVYGQDARLEDALANGRVR